MQSMPCRVHPPAALQSRIVPCRACPVGCIHLQHFSLRYAGLQAKGIRQGAIRWLCLQSAGPRLVSTGLCLEFTSIFCLSLSWAVHACSIETSSVLIRELPVELLARNEFWPDYHPSAHQAAPAVPTEGRDYPRNRLLPGGHCCREANVTSACLLWSGISNTEHGDAKA